MSDNSKTIPIEKAKQWTEKWQQAHPSESKAFLIPIDDLLNCLREMKVITKTDGSIVINDIPNAGVRAYMAIDSRQKTVKKEKLLMVATRIDKKGIHRDIVADEKNAPGINAPGIMDGSGVFDFSQPCPNTCDTNSPLYHDTSK